MASRNGLGTTNDSVKTFEWRGLVWCWIGARKVEPIIRGFGLLEKVRLFEEICRLLEDEMSGRRDIAKIDRLWHEEINPIFENCDDSDLPLEWTIMALTPGTWGVLLILESEKGPFEIEADSDRARAARSCMFTIAATLDANLLRYWGSRKKYPYRLYDAEKASQQYLDGVLREAQSWSPELSTVIDAEVEKVSSQFGKAMEMIPNDESFGTPRYWGTD